MGEWLWSKVINLRFCIPQFQVQSNSAVAFATKNQLLLVALLQRNKFWILSTKMLQDEMAILLQGNNKLQLLYT